MTLGQLALIPLLPPPLLAGLALLTALPLLLAALRRARGTAWRAAAALIALAFLAGPALVVRTGTKLPSIALLAVDQSGSMQVDDRARLAEAAASALTAQAAARPGLQLRRIDVTDTGAAGTQ
jgi:hypothetical protein